MPVPMALQKIVRMQIFKITITVVILFVMLSGFCISFVQFYPFPQSPLLAKIHYPTVTSTASGQPGDPINVMIVGSSAAIREDFLRAGWTIPDPITSETSAKIVFDSISNLPYPTAPVSNLYLFQRKQDMAFEKPTDTVQVRDHIRLWDTHTKLGSEEVWLGSATYDHGIEISSKTDMPTHHVAPDVDQERDMVYQTLKPYMQYSTVVPFTHPTFFRVNGGGDWYYTDGEIVILSKISPDRGYIVANRSAAVTVKNWIFRVVTFLVRFFP